MSEAAPPTRGLLIARAAAYGAFVAVPVALINTVLAAQDPPPALALNLTLLGLLVGFGVSGFAAGSTVDRDPLQAGAAAAAITFVPVEVIGLLGRADRGDPISLFPIVVVGFLAALAGTAGARFGRGRRLRKDPS